MAEQNTTIVSKIWAMCNPLWGDGISYGDYLEQSRALRQSILRQAFEVD